MTDIQEKQDKSKKDLEAPPRTEDPKLSQRVDFTEKVMKKIIVTTKREDLDK